MRLHRLMAIILLIESRGKMKAKDLAFALATSVRSIYRDIDSLAKSGIPLVTTSGPGGGIHLMEGYTTMNLKQFDGEDVINLYLTGMELYAGGTESGLKLKNTLAKLEETLPAFYKSDVLKAKAQFYFDDTPTWTEHVSIPCLETLRRSVWRSRRIAISYGNVNDTRVQILHPYGLVVRKGEWYLIAYCEEMCEIRTFRCERILRANLTEDEFEMPPDFSLERHWNKQVSVVKQSYEEKYYPVVMKVQMAELSNILNKMEIVHSIPYGNYIILTVNMDSYEGACHDVMDIIGYTEIVEPAPLRQWVKERIAQIQRLY